MKFNISQNDKIRNTIWDELEEEATSPTLDNLLMEFIRLNMEVYMDCNGGATIYDAISYIKSDEFNNTLDYYKEKVISQVIRENGGPKYSPNDLVWIPKEQLDELLKAAGR